MLSCTCEGWKTGYAQILSVQHLADLHGQEYTGPAFNYCPWCGAVLGEQRSPTQCLLVRHGTCCCICRNRVHINSNFPNNTHLAWGCTGFVVNEGSDIVYSGDFEHGVCELFERIRGA